MPEGGAVASELAYAGDVDPQGTWKALSEDPGAVLVDVRTDAEWRFVGLPDLSSLGKQVALVPWQGYPDMRLNEGFVDQVRAAGVSEAQSVYLICRSGQRSRDAAIALTAAGFARCHNVAEGFEGPMDDDAHRGRVSGWKVRGLPWRQT